jgi:hypothetical protein
VTIFIELAGSAINLGLLIIAWRSLHSGQQKINVMVDGNLSAALARGVQLTATLKGAGVDVPPPDHPGGGTPAADQASPSGQVGS